MNNKNRRTGENHIACCFDMHGTYINVVIKNNAALRAMTFAPCQSNAKKKKKKNEMKREEGKEKLRNSNRNLFFVRHPIRKAYLQVFNTKSTAVSQ